MMLFQSTLPRRERHAKPVHILRVSCFNPRSREGSDYAGYSKEITDDVSIHAPAKGATLHIIPDTVTGHVSIHAPAKGATTADEIAAANDAFQSTLPRRERLCGVYIVKP